MTPYVTHLSLNGNKSGKWWVPSPMKTLQAVPPPPLARQIHINSLMEVREVIIERPRVLMSGSPITMYYLDHKIPEDDVCLNTEYL